ncbi:hypothetical protein POJ06DRAFT_248577 [Lipomyces tetrasporus]|uniref:Uncharacterized protein n=1 Tax=Lipomyces tetrasporus TaxID=54092 RepID=A0AAD7QV28_9ASCO|nr:uncharacterized protein POJ06DRAFT_248577 [Lipomyces tetrasporus]KAJ8102035.1 hypothetical protein POJ06DRAFT_248577 [Lipomyces tetrasporus]
MRPCHLLRLWSAFLQEASCRIDSPKKTPGTHLSSSDRPGTQGRLPTAALMSLLTVAKRPPYRTASPRTKLEAHSASTTPTLDTIVACAKDHAVFAHLEEAQGDSLLQESASNARHFHTVSKALNSLPKPSPNLLIWKFLHRQLRGIVRMF